jgi:methylated-DNA-[protein]-cysteine S-methyltransferase
MGQTSRMIQLSQFDSPLGKIAVVERKGRALAIGFRGRRGLRAEHPQIWQLGEVTEEGEGPGATAVRRYLRGEVTRLRLPIDLSLVKGEFDRLVLERLYKSQFGQTFRYGELAALVGRPRAARAVGGAMRRNPIPILIPCHRVLPSTGRLGNYTGGVEKKAWLLDREGVSWGT